MASHSIFNELYRILDEYKIDDLKKFQRKSSPVKREIATLIVSFYRDNLRNILNMLNRSQGIVFNFERFNSKWHSYEKIAKKSTFYSDISVVLFDGRAASSQLLRKEPHRRYSENANASRSVQDVIGLLLSIKHLVLKNILIPLPDSIRLDTTIGRYDPLLSFDYADAVNRIKNGDLESTIVPVYMDKWQTRAQVNEHEDYFKGKRELKPITIYLPQLSNLSTESLIGVREDCFDHFYNFQQGLKTFLNSSTTINSESLFVELVRKVDHEISEIEQKIVDIQQQKRRKGVETFLGMGTSAVSFLVDPELAKYIGGFFASKTAFDGFSFLHNSESSKNLETHKYYLAYKVKELSNS